MTTSRAADIQINNIKLCVIWFRRLFSKKKKKKQSKVLNSYKWKVKTTVAQEVQHTGSLSI